MKLFEEVLQEELNTSGENTLQLLKMIAKCSQGMQKEEALAKIQNANSIKISSVNDVFTEDEIKRIKSGIQLEKKECYKNATNFTIAFPERVKYCEGIFSYKGLPIDHAFNLVDDKYYIDLTREFLLQESGIANDDTYVCYATYSFDELLNVLEKTMYYGGVFEYIFRKNLKEK